MKLIKMMKNSQHWRENYLGHIAPLFFHDAKAPKKENFI